MNKDNLNFISGFRYLVELGWPVIFIIFLSFMASLVEAVGLLGVLPVILGEVPSEIGFLNSLLQGLSFTTVLFLFFLIFIVKSFFYFASLAMIAIYKGRLLYKLKSELFNAYTFARYKDLDKSVGYFSNIIGEQATKSLQAFNFLIEMLLKQIF